MMPDLVSWHDANQICSNMTPSSELVSIHGIREEAFVTTLTLDLGNTWAWIGGTDNLDKGSLVLV